MKTRRTFLSGMLMMAGAGPLGGAESRMEAGTRFFFAGKLDEALREWDAQVAEDSASEPYHWQRGIAQYLAGKYAEGQRQFEKHRKVNPRDVENAAWHFACVARQEDEAAARKVIIPVTGDGRVPMKEIHALYAGNGSEEAVLAAAERAEAGEGGAAELRNQRCYARLYLGLHHEACGRPDKAREHLLMAAEDYRMEHYMGRVARVHCQVRGWKKEG